MCFIATNHPHINKNKIHKLPGNHQRLYGRVKYSIMPQPLTIISESKYRVASQQQNLILKSHLKTNHSTDHSTRD